MRQSAKAFHRSKRTRRAGFTVLEVLISMVIIVIGFAAIFALLLQGTASERAAVDTTNAAILAASVFDDVSAKYLTLYYDDNNNGTPDLLETSNVGGPPPAALAELPKMRGYQYTIHFSQAVPQDMERRYRAVFVTVQVFWRARGDGYSKTWHRVIYPVLPDVINVESIEKMAT